MKIIRFADQDPIQPVVYGSAKRYSLLTDDPEEIAEYMRLLKQNFDDTEGSGKGKKGNQKTEEQKKDKKDEWNTSALKGALVISSGLAIDDATILGGYR